MVLKLREFNLNGGRWNKLKAKISLIERTKYNYNGIIIPLLCTWRDESCLDMFYGGGKKYPCSIIAFENDVNVIQLCNKLREFNGVIRLRATQRIPDTNYVLLRHEQLIIPRAYPLLIVFFYISIDEKTNEKKKKQIDEIQINTYT